MIRRTPKRIMGVRQLMRVLDRSAAYISNLPNDTLYKELAKKGFYWHADSKEWTKEPLATSIFVDAYGNPTRKARIRITAHPDVAVELQDLIVAYLTGCGAEFTRISHPNMNRNGAGARIYLATALPPKARKKR